MTDRVADTDPTIQAVSLAANTDATAITDENVDAFVEALGFPPEIGDGLVDALQRMGEWDTATAADGEFEFRIGSWHLDVAREGIRAGLLYSLVAATFAISDVDWAGLAAVAGVLPALVDIRRVEWRAGDERLLVELRRRDVLTDESTDIDELYDTIPSELGINRYDFHDFIQRLREAGRAEGDATTIRVRQEDEPVPFIQWT